MDEIKNIKKYQKHKKKSYLLTERAIIELQVHLFFIFPFSFWLIIGAGVSWLLLFVQ